MNDESWQGLNGLRRAGARMLHQQNVLAEVEYANHELLYAHKSLSMGFEIKYDEIEQGLLKGIKGGNCNRTACQKPGAIFLNKSTRFYYCGDCAKEINWPGGRELTLKLYGTPLLCEVDDDVELMEMMRQTAKVDQSPVAPGSGFEMSVGEFTSALCIRDELDRVVVHKSSAVGMSTMLVDDSPRNVHYLKNLHEMSGHDLDIYTGRKPEQRRIHTMPRLNKAQKKALKKARRA